MKNLIHYCDTLAIPFFLLGFIYFYKIKHKSLVEYLLLLFMLSGLIVDIIFSYLYFFENKKMKYI